MALAADGLIPTKGYQFANDECLESGIALALLETRLGVAAAMGHGFAPAAKDRLTVTALADGDNSGYELATLNGRAPSELLQVEWNTQSLPVLGLPAGAEHRLILPIPEPTLQGQYIRVNRRVSRGDNLYWMDASPTEMMHAGHKAVERARDRAGATGPDLAFIAVFACIARFLRNRGPRSVGTRL